MENVKFIGLGIALTALSYGICLIFGIPFTFNWLEFLAVATSYSCTILFMLQKRVAYFYGIISTFFLCLFFYSVSLPALALFNGILVVSLLYGWWRWGPDGKPIPVTRIDNVKSWLGYGSFFILVGSLFAAIIGVGSKMDLTLAAGSATAQLMLDNKKIETWLLWIVVNILSIAFFINQGLIIMAIQFIAFLINAVVALVRWKKDLKKENVDV